MVTWSHGVVAALALSGAGCATARSVSGSDRVDQVQLLDGPRVAWASALDPEKPTLVVFATLWCEVCRQERPAVQAWARAHQGQVRTLYVFSGGELPGVVAQIRAVGLDPSALTVVVDADGSLADRHGVEATPTLVLLGPGGGRLAVWHRIEAVQLP
jgi:thiol-disulfide isomerase/thioredoxin